MYCIYCGKPIPDGGKCNCKDPVNLHKPDYPYSAPIAASVPPTASPYTPPEYAFTNSVTPQPDNVFCDTLKSAFGTPTMLIFAILTCLAFILDLVSFNLNIATLLTIIGAFLVYSNSRKKNDVTKKTGYTLLSIVTIANLITHCVISVSLLIYLILLIVSGSMDKQVTYIVRMFNEDFMHSTIRLTTLANVSICLIAFAVILLVFLYLLTLNSNLTYIRRRISSPAAKGNYINFPNVMMILHGVIGFVAAIFIIKEQTLLADMMYDILKSEFTTVYKMLSISLKFGLPATLIVMSIARIFAGITLCSFNSKFKRIK